MLDAIGKLPSGLMLGNMHWPGMYGECLEISSKESETQKMDNSTVLGKHCLMTIGDTSMPVCNVLNERRLFSRCRLNISVLASSGLQAVAFDLY